VYSALLTGEYGQSWHGLTVAAAIGGVVLFVSAMAFVSVFVSTAMAGRRIEPPPFEFAIPLQPVTSMGLWDRFGLWTVVAIVLVVMAYAYPILTLIGHTRYGSVGQTPF
jgi:cytochrome c oxidase subunit 1